MPGGPAAPLFSSYGLTFSGHKLPFLLTPIIHRPSGDLQPREAKRRWSDTFRSRCLKTLVVPGKQKAFAKRRETAGSRDCKSLAMTAAIVALAIVIRANFAELAQQCARLGATASIPTRN